MKFLRFEVQHPVKFFSHFLNRGCGTIRMGGKVPSKTLQQKHGSVENHISFCSGKRALHCDDIHKVKNQSHATIIAAMRMTLH